MFRTFYDSPSDIDDVGAPAWTNMMMIVCLSRRVSSRGTLFVDRFRIVECQAWRRARRSCSSLLASEIDRTQTCLHVGIVVGTFPITFGECFLIFGALGSDAAAVAVDSIHQAQPKRGKTEGVGACCTDGLTWVVLRLWFPDRGIEH